jgi:hypothetical protein
MSDCTASTEFTVRKIELSTKVDRRFRLPCLRYGPRFNLAFVPQFIALSRWTDVALTDPLRLVRLLRPLIDFRIGDVARDRLAARVPAARMAAFLEDFTAYRFDDVLGAWKPYREVLHRSLERSCRRWGFAFDPAAFGGLGQR